MRISRPMALSRRTAIIYLAVFKRIINHFDISLDAYGIRNGRRGRGFCSTMIFKPC